MDLFDPSESKPIHFMGIGGAGMSSLALLACRRGVAVTGCDLEPGGADDLAALGVSVARGHDARHVGGARALVVTAAVPSDHPELQAARAAGVPVIPRKQALAQLVAGRTVVGIAGTHGKSTTTVMTTLALDAAGLDPTGLAGGRVQDWGGNARPGSDRLFVVEADEYDQAFLTLSPAVAVVNNVEADHLECYGSVEALEDAFVEFAGRADRALLGADDAGARRVGGRLSTRPWYFGEHDADLVLRPVRQDRHGSEAELRFPDGRTLRLRLAVPGLHNLRNATAALGVVAACEGDLGRAAAALAEYQGLGRRFERLGEVQGVMVVDDYAHHPSELRATLEAARQAYPDRRLVAVFQPHLYSRTAAQGEAMGQALAAADLALVTEIYGAREAPVPGVSGRRVADAVRAAGGRGEFEADRARVLSRVRELIRPGDVVLTLGAGDITRVGHELVAWLRAA